MRVAVWFSSDLARTCRQKMARSLSGIRALAPSWPRSWDGPVDRVAVEHSVHRGERLRLAELGLRLTTRGRVWCVDHAVTGGVDEAPLGLSLATPQHEHHRLLPRA